MTESKPVLLSGGNPQITKGDGHAPVAAYIAAMPGWKHDVGRDLDDLIEQTIPTVHKAVRWNSPFYGIADNGWFASYHCFTSYVKLTFFVGALLTPEPPERSKDENARHLHIKQHDELDPQLLTNWIEQAATLRGWHGF